MSVFWTWLPDFWSAVLGALPAVAFVTGFVKWREFRRRRAFGSHLTVKDGVEKNGYRRAALTLTGWTDATLQLRAIRFCPPFKGIVMVTTANEWYTELRPDAEVRSWPIPNPPIILEKSKRTKLTVAVRRPLPLWLARRLKLRLRVVVTAETIDAQRRRESLPLRSARVDWSREPQE